MKSNSKLGSPREKYRNETVPEKRKRSSLLYVFIGLCLCIAAACITYFVLYETGYVHVNTELPDGSFFSGYWKMGEPFGEGMLVTKDGEVIEGVWNDGHLDSGLVINKEFTYEGRLKDYLPEGYGSCHYKNGVQYYGFWKNGIKDGLGRLTTPKGELAFGMWKNGELPPVPGQKYEPGQHVFGIDVSKHQANINWEHMCLYADSVGRVEGNLTSSKYLQPVLFAVIKSTEGADFQDKKYTENMIQARRCGIVAGAYHFLRLSDIDEQINNFIKNTVLLPGDFPPVLDIELSNAEMAKNKTKAIAYAHKWLEAMEKHYGVKPILYTYDSFYNDYLRGQGFDGYDYFIARYDPTKQPTVPHLEIWQYSEHGHAGGIKKFVDLDFFFGSYANFRHYVDTKCIQ